MRRDAPHILLVNPWIHDFAAYDAWAKPMGLLTLAAILRDHGCRVSYADCQDRFHPRAPRSAAGHRHGRGPFRKTVIPKPVQLADVPRRFARYGIDPEWFREDLTRLKTPDLILVTSAMTYWYTGVQETISVLRQVFPEVPLVLGGIYATLCTDHARRWSGADQVLTGPGEAAVLNLVRAYTGWPATMRFDPQDLSTYPFPAFDLQRRVEYVPILTVRGCPFACSYCAAHLLETRRLRRDPASVVAELAYWHHHWRVSDFVLYDDAFLDDAEHHCLPLLEAVVTSGLRVRFHTPNALHIRGITPETARLMFAAGFTTLRLGLETVFENRAKLDRKVTPAEFDRSVQVLREAGFKPEQIGAYLLVGLPHQDPAAILESIEYVKCSGIRPVLAYYSPLPGTALWPEARSASRYELDSDPLFTNKAILPCQPDPFSWHWVSILKQKAEA